MAVMFVNGSGQNEQSLERTFHRCFLPNFSWFGWEVSEEKIKMWKVNGLKRRQTPSDGKSQIFAKVTKFQQIYFRFVNSRRIIAGLLRFVNFHTTLFQNVLYWCLELTRHNIGTPLKYNKYIFDIPISFCHNPYLSATFKQWFTEFAGF